MCTAGQAGGMQGAGAVMGAYSAYKGAQATKASDEYQAAIDRNNAAYAEFAASDAIRKGQFDTGNSRLKYASLAGKQTASMAAANVDTSQGSAARILADTKYASDVDAATITQNAVMQAWGFKVQAQGDNANADLMKYHADSTSPGMAAFGSLLGSGATVADSWYRAKNPYGAAGLPA